MAATGDVTVILLPVVEEGKDGVDEEHEDHAQDGQLLHAHIKLRCCHFEWRIKGSCGIVIG